MYCPSAEQAAQLNEKIAELKAERQREQEELKEAKRRAEQERRDEARRRIEERRESARQKEEARKAEIARNKAEADARRQAAIDAKKQAEQAKHLAAEAEAKRKTDEIIKKATEAEAKRRADAEAKRKSEEAKRAEDALLKSLQAEKERQRATEAEAKRKAEVEAKERADLAKKLGAEAEAKRKAELAAQTAAAAEAKRKAEADAKQKADEAKREIMEDARQAAKLKKEADAKKIADTEFDKQLRAIVNNRKESLTQRKIAAIALGIDPSILGNGSKSAIAQFKTKVTSDADREIAKFALGKVKAATTTAPTSLDDQMRAIMNDPKQSAASRQIAAIGLGIDPASLRLTKTSIPSSGSTVSSNVPSRADDFLRAVMNDPKRSLNDQRDAARALKDTPTFREIAAIGLGADAATFGSTNPTIQPSAGLAALTPAQIQFFKNNIVSLTPSSSRTVESSKAGTPPNAIRIASVMGFTTTVQEKQNASIWYRLERSISFANQSTSDDPNFQTGKKELTITVAIASTGCIVGGGLGAVAGGVGALPGCVGGAELATGVYGAGAFGIDVAKGVLDVAAHQYGKGTMQVVQTIRDEFADYPSNVGGVASVVKAGGSWGTYFLYGFYNNVPEQ